MISSISSLFNKRIYITREIKNKKTNFILSSDGGITVWIINEDENWTDLINK